LEINLLERENSSNANQSDFSISKKRWTFLTNIIVTKKHESANFEKLMCIIYFIKNIDRYVK